MIATLVRHPNAANLLMVGIIILGVLALPSLKRETFPEIANDKVEVRAVYPGATAEEVESAICRRIEDRLEGIGALDQVQCEARENLAVATATMREGSDMARFLDDISTEVESIDDFPDLVEKPVVTELARQEFVVSIAATGPESAVDLKTYAEQLKSKLQYKVDVADVAVRGFSDRQLRIEVPLDQLERYGLSASDVAAAIGRQNVGLPSGLLEGREEDLILRVDDQRRDPARIGDIVVISGETGAEIRLSDIARISDVFDRPEDMVMFNGRRAAMLDIYKRRDQDTLTVIGQVDDFIADERRILPEGMALAKTRDLSSIVRDRLQMLYTNGVQGLVLVFLILWLFFNIRYGFWVAMGLPVSFLGSLYLMAQIDMSINMISMVGLLIAIGLLMDDAIVIAENVGVHLDRGESPADAAIKGTQEVLPGVFSSFLTTVLIFGALAFLVGEIGQIMRIMPIVLIGTLAISLVEAFLILPHHLYKSLEPAVGRPPNRFRQRFETAFSRLTHRGFGRLLDLALRHRYLTVGLVFGLVLISVAALAGGILKFRAFPDIDGDVVEARLLLPQGTPLARTRQIVDRLVVAVHEIDEELAADQPDGVALVRNVAVIFGANPDAYETGPHVAQVSVDLLGAERRGTTIDQFLDLWRKKVGLPVDVIALKFTEPALGPAGRAIEIRMLGDDMTALKAASQDLQAYLGGFRGVRDLNDDLRPGKREVLLRLKPGAGSLGVNSRLLADQLRAAYQGATIDEFQDGGETYELELRLRAGDRQNLADLEDLPVVTAQGVLIPLRAVATMEQGRGWARINRYDGRRAVTIHGDVDFSLANAQEIVNQATQDQKSILEQRYPGIVWSVEGESARTQKTGGSLIFNMLHGLIGVYLLLAFQFRSYVMPIAVMIVIPTALTGAVSGHLLAGLDLSMPSMIGLASLAGIVVNNSILLILFMNRERNQGHDAVAAAGHAGRARFRPIVLTTLTTVAGLMPLLLETSLQAQVLIPLAISLAAGLAAATFLALFLVPCFYCILDDVGLLHEIEVGETVDPPASALQERL